MKKEGKNKSKAALITMMLVLSTVLILTTIPTVNADFIAVENDYRGISGESIWIHAEGFDNNEYVMVNFSNDHAGTDWPDDYLKLARANSSGAINTTINIPWRDEPGEYYISLYGRTSGTPFNHTFNITDIYKVVIDPEVIYWDDSEPQDFTITIYNWTANGYKLLTKNVRYTFYTPSKDVVISSTTNNGVEVTAALFNWSDDGTLTGNREANYTLNITTPDSPYTVLASNWVPVRFHLTGLTPTTAVYGQTKTLKGRFIDGGDDYVKYLDNVQIISPTYVIYNDPVITNVYGDFTFAMYFNEAGTWYIGTNVSGGIGRPTDEETTKGLTDFIWYGTVEVASAEGTITVDPDEEVYGFDVELEIYCEDADGDPIPDGSHVYVTGVETEIMGVTNDADDFTELVTIENPAGTINGYLNITLDDEFKYNESGTATFWVYYDQTWAYYDANEDEEPLIKASTHVDVMTPSNMNVFVDYDAEAVWVDDDWIDDHWQNLSSPLNVTVYGKTDATMKNASIKVTGCGLDLEFDETNQPVDGYSYLISPRNGGILTVTVTNETGDITVTEDIEIIGLVSNAVTSIGGDKEITVDTEEMITFTVIDAFYAETHLNLFDESWGWIAELNMTNGTNEAGNGDDGIYIFTPETDTLGHIVIAAKAGYGGDIFYTYDIVDIVPEYDLIINITEPEAINRTFTAGLEYDIFIDITNETDYELQASDILDVIWELMDENDTVLYNGNFVHDSGNTWELVNQIFMEKGTLLITVTAFEGKHAGNNSQISVEYAEFEYMPSSLTVGISLEDIGVDIIAKNALGNLLEDTEFIMNPTDANDTLLAGNSSGTLYTDDFGEATIWFTEVGDIRGSFCASINGANTTGELEIAWPIFTLNPEIIYVGYENDVLIKAEDMDGNPIEGINLSLTPSVLAMTGGSLPDPIVTGEDGWLIEPLSIHPTASGVLNVTIAQDIHYEAGQLNWTKLLTDTIVEAKAKQAIELTVSKSPIYQGETLTVTVKAGGVAVKDVDIKFGSLTGKTDANGEVDFIVPDPGVESATYYIKAEKIGYVTTEIGISVIKKYAISIDVPDEVFAGQSFTVTIIAKGQPLAGATVTLDGTTTKMSGGDGKATFTAGAKDATHTIKATSEPYTAGQATVGPVKEKGVPGFELLTLVIAIGVAFILLRRRKQN